MQKARVASVSYLNSLPLTWGLQHGRQRGLFELQFHSPAECARLLQDGMVDLALIPSVEFERTLGLVAVPGTGVVSRREVRSVLLLTRTDPRDIRSLAVDFNSRTSVALTCILLARRYGARPQLHPMPPDPGPMLEACDAALLIGDPALRASVSAEQQPAAGGPRTIDLAREWNEMTGLPFVFAFWACRPVLDVPAVREILEMSLAEGIKAIDRIADEEAPRTGLPPASIASYLRRNIHYRIGPEESESLRSFYRLCREEGLIPAYEADRPARSSGTVNRG
ncbi:MAG: menaquinone biosynthetic enzyme MqnA/MqnD family protein [Candidatus Polarisedimenticolia bacterium]